MPYRNVTTLFSGLAASLSGLLLVGILAACRADLRHASCTGPRWKRRLVAAGLLLLAGLGWGGARREAPAASAAQAAEAKPAELAASPRWTRLVAAWREAEEVTSGKRGDYPFDEAGKQHLLKALALAAADVHALAGEGLLTEPEAGLLMAHLKVLADGVQAKRPTEMRRATCYKPMLIRPGAQSLQRLKLRLPVLERLAASRKLHPQAVALVLGTVEADLETLQEKRNLDALTGVERTEAQGVARSIRAQVDRIRARLTS